MYFLFLVFALINSAFANSFTFIGQVPYNGITVNLTDVFLRAVKDVARYKNKIALCKCHSISDLLSVDDEKFLYNINRVFCYHFFIFIVINNRITIIYFSTNT